MPDKSNHIKRFAAFTLMDLLTGMVITSIIVAMVFYLLTAINKQSYTYANVRYELNEFILLNADLNRETDNCKRIQEIPFGFTLLSDKKEITYKKSENLFLRITEFSTDTIHHDIKSIAYTYAENNTISEQKLITTITIKIAIEEQELTSYFYKDYGLAEPINYALLNEL
jgi:Tfp pilus assembly protein FimT